MTLCYVIWKPDVRIFEPTLKFRLKVGFFFRINAKKKINELNTYSSKSSFQLYLETKY